MTKQEFLKELGDSLLQEVSQAEYTESIRYYENYISETMQSGQKESEVVAMLGSPRLIAKSIVEASQGTTSADAYGSGTAGTYYQEDNGRQGHFEKGKVPFMNKFKLDTWYGKVGAVLTAIVVVALLFAILRLVLAFAWNVVLPIVVVVCLISFILKKFKGK